MEKIKIKNINLKNNLDTKYKEVLLKHNEIKQNDIRIENLNNDLKVKEKNINKLKQNIDLYLKNISDLNKNINILNEEKENILEKNKGLESDLKNATNEIKDLKSKNKLLSEDLDNKEKKVIFELQKEMEIIKQNLGKSKENLKKLEEKEIIMKSNIEENNKRITQYKEENKKLKYLNDKILSDFKQKENEINDLESKLEENENFLEEKNKEYLFEKEELETENQKLIYNNNFLFDIINNIYNNLDINFAFFQQYNDEIEKINSSLKNTNCITDITNLSKIKKPKKIEEDDGSHKINEEILIDEEKLNEFKKELDTKIENSSKNYYNLIQSYIYLINNYNQKIKEEKLLSNELNKINDNIYNKLLPKIIDLEEDNITKEKKI